MDAEMSFLNELVRTVRESADLTLEAAAMHADLSITCVHRYEMGEREVSLRYFRALFAATGDLRLLRYFNPLIAERLQEQFCQCDACKAKRNVAQPPSAVTPKRTPPPPRELAELLPRELEALRKLTDAATYVCKIVGDGQVDDSDNAAILQLAWLHDQARAIMDSTDRALIARREAAKS